MILQAKEIEGEELKEGNRIQSEEKVSEANNINKCNKETSEEK